MTRRRSYRSSIALVLGMALGSALLGAAILPAESAPADPQTITALIDSAAERWGLPAGRMRCIAYRESTFRPLATSPGGHKGLWQFSDRTWAWAAHAIGLDQASPYDPESSTEVAAWLMSQPGGFSHWSTSRWCV